MRPSREKSFISPTRRRLFEGQHGLELVLADFAVRIHRQRVDADDPRGSLVGGKARGEERPQLRFIPVSESGLQFDERDDFLLTVAQSRVQPPQTTSPPGGC